MRYDANKSHITHYTRRVCRAICDSERGSALLITMIVITILGTIAFAIGGSTISALRRQSQLEDSQNAYQAAVSGLEDGLLRWRYNKDTETPIARVSSGKSTEGGDFACASATRPTTSSKFFDRINLSTGEVTYCLDPDKTKPPSPSNIVYDIKIQYKKDPGEAEVVKSETTAAGTIPALAKDQVVEYDISELPKLGVSTVNLGWAFQNYSFTDLTQNLEVYSLDDTGKIIDNSKKLFDRIVTRQAQFAPIPFPTLGGVKIRIHPYGTDLKSYQIKTNSSQIALDSRITTIEVTGYFGQAKRKLKLALDRASGSILPIYDNVLFSETGDIKPQ